jgi:hypothetical protein
MAHQGYDFQLTRYDECGWRATFYTTGMEHSITSATASAWERTPWHAVQGAARDALRQAAGVTDDGAVGKRSDPCCRASRWLCHPAEHPRTRAHVGRLGCLQGRGRVTHWQIDRIDPDGKIWWWTTGSPYGLQEIEACMKEEWAKRK